MNYRLLIAGVFSPEYSYISKRAKKIDPPANHASRLREKIPFINAIQPFYGCDEMHVKILPLLCRLELVLRLGSSLG